MLSCRHAADWSRPSEQSLALQNTIDTSLSRCRAIRARQSTVKRRNTNAVRCALQQQQEANVFNAKSDQSRYDPQYQGFMEGMSQGYFTVAAEPSGYYLDVVEGCIPKELHGTYFRNGPGRFQAGCQAYGHPYDGDGLVVSISFRDGRAFYRSAFVDTPELAAETAARTILFRNAFATQREGGAFSNAFDVYVKNTSNTNVIEWGGRCLSLFEAGQPYRLDPWTLQTQGLDDLDGWAVSGQPTSLGSAAADALASVSMRLMGNGRGAPPHMSRLGGVAITAHPRHCSSTGRLVVLGYQVVATAKGQLTQLTFREFDTEWQEQACTSYSLQGYAFVHDFAITEHYIAVFQNPVAVNIPKVLLGIAPAASCIEWREGIPTYVHIIPRNTHHLHTATAAVTDSASKPEVEVGNVASFSKRGRVYEASPTFVFHHANAYEGDNGEVVIDSIAYPRMPEIWPEGNLDAQVDADAAFEGGLHRTVVQLHSGQVSSHRVWPGYLEMVAINEQVSGRRHQYVYAYNSVFDQQQIGTAKLRPATGDVERYLPGQGVFLSQPTFVASPTMTAEDDGWLLVMSYNSNSRSSELLILDAQHVAQGPVARLRLRNAIPHPVHCSWSSTCYAPLQ